jgi:hypothetical protein
MLVLFHFTCTQLRTSGTSGKLCYRGEVQHSMELPPRSGLDPHQSSQRLRHTGEMSQAVTLYTITSISYRLRELPSPLMGLDADRQPGQ